jgi:serine/threonine protein kinase
MEGITFDLSGSTSNYGVVAVERINSTPGLTSALVEILNLPLTLIPMFFGKHRAILSTSDGMKVVKIYFLQNVISFDREVESTKFFSSSDCGRFVKFVGSQHVGNARIIVTEYGGADLHELYIACGERCDAFALAEFLTDAVSTVHKHDWTHGDIKPENVTRKPDGSWQLIDFGAARHAEKDPLGRRRIGTQQYMIPSSTDRHDTHHDRMRADMYAAAMTILVTTTDMDINTSYCSQCVRLERKCLSCCGGRRYVRICYQSIVNILQGRSECNNHNEIIHATAQVVLTALYSLRHTMYIVWESTNMEASYISRSTAQILLFDPTSSPLPNTSVENAWLGLLAAIDHAPQAQV